MNSLRWKLIATLIVVALLPALPAMLTVNEVVQRGLEASGEEEALEGLRTGLRVVRRDLEREKQTMQEAMVSRELSPVSADAIATLPPDQQSWFERVGSESGEIAPGRTLLLAPTRTVLGDRQVLAAQVQETGTLNWYAQELPADLVQDATTLTESVQLLETIRRERRPVARSLLATFALVYGIILITVVGLGFFIASRLAKPLDALTEGIGEVGSGNLNVRVDEENAGQLRGLTTQFNGMVSELKTGREELVRLEKIATWRNFARRMAHEVKNPLTPIQLAAQQLRDTYKGDDKDFGEMLKEGTEIIEEEVQSLRGLVQEFSEFSRMPEPKIEAANPQKIVNDLTGLYGDQLQVSHQDPLPTVAMDATEIHRVLINLINNGLHAQEDTKAQDPIQLELRRQNGRLLWTVSDRGPGVPPDKRGKIFEPDFSTKKEGMGLGLAIVTEVLRAHKAVIEVKDRDGGGAVFEFALPLATDKES